MLTFLPDRYKGGNDPALDPKYPDPRPAGYKGKLQCGVYRPTNVISSSFGIELESDLPYSYQRRQCDEWLKLGLQGVSVFWASGDQGVGECIEDGRVFQLGQSTGCPYVYMLAECCPELTSTIGGSLLWAERKSAAIIPYMTIRRRG